MVMPSVSVSSVAIIGGKNHNRFVGNVKTGALMTFLHTCLTNGARDCPQTAHRHHQGLPFLPGLKKPRYCRAANNCIRLPTLSQPPPTPVDDASVYTCNLPMPCAIRSHYHEGVLANSSVVTLRSGIAMIHRCNQTTTAA